MHPILVQIGDLSLYSFGLMVALGFLLGTLWVMKRAFQARENVDDYLQAIFWITLSGFIGARLLYVIYFPEAYLASPVTILTDRGGLVWYGGLISAFLASVIFTRLKKIDLLRFGDILSLPAALGLAIGRIGCFLSGCCYGRHTDLPWGVHFPQGHDTFPQAVHPTQLYESLALLLFVGLMLAVVRRSEKPRGMMLASLLIGYGIIRFSIEYLRGDVIYWVGHLFTASQVFSLVGILAGVVMLVIFRTRPGHVGADSLKPSNV